jgi:hypothetical protein
LHISYCFGVVEGDIIPKNFWSGTYAVLDQSATIKATHLKAALAVWEYCEQSARLIFGERLGDPTADRIVEALRTAGPTGMSDNDIYELFGRNKSANDRARALNLLAALGLARAEKEDTGGRPRTVWRATCKTCKGVKRPQPISTFCTFTTSPLREESAMGHYLDLVKQMEARLRTAPLPVSYADALSSLACVPEVLAIAGAAASTNAQAPEAPTVQRVPDACYACGTRRRWRSVYGAVVCARCHPPPDAAAVAAWEGRTSERPICPRLLVSPRRSDNSKGPTTLERERSSMRKDESQTS